MAGVEGVGRVAVLGEDVTDIAEGQRVGWFSGGQGTYADYVVVDAARTVTVPDGVPDDTAVALLMQGVTAHYLSTDATPSRTATPSLSTRPRAVWANC